MVRKRRASVSEELSTSSLPNKGCLNRPRITPSRNRSASSSLLRNRPSNGFQMTGPNVAACAEELPAPLPDVEKVRLIAGPALQEIWSRMGEPRVMQETLFQASASSAMSRTITFFARSTRSSTFRRSGRISRRTRARRVARYPLRPTLSPVMPIPTGFGLPGVLVAAKAQYSRQFGRHLENPGKASLTLMRD